MPLFLISFNAIASAMVEGPTKADAISRFFTGRSYAPLEVIPNPEGASIWINEEDDAPTRKLTK